MLSSFTIICISLVIIVSSQNNNYPSKGCSSNNQPAGNNATKQFSMTFNGTERTYYVHVPINYQQKSTTGQPLVLALHGYGGTGYSMAEYFGMVPQSNEYNYVAVFPQGSYMRVNGKQYSSWNDLSCSGSPGPDGPTCNVLNTEQYPMLPECKDPDGNHCNWCTCAADDISFIDALLTQVENLFCIDRSREYATGFSNGATMTHQLGISLNNRLAAVAPMHGLLAIGFNNPPIYKQTIPIMIVWGLQDDVEPGVNVIAWNGFYCLSFSGVMNRFGEHNQCNTHNGYVNITTSSDGIMKWQCMQYKQSQCQNNAEVRACSWNGKHTYPMTNNGFNFALNVTWNFFKQHTRIPPS
eukprot:177065_1